MNKPFFLLLTITTLLGCKSTTNRTFLIEDIEHSERRAELSSSPERIRLYQDLIRSKQNELSAILATVPSYPSGSEEYTQLYSRASKISDQIKNLEQRLAEEKASLAQLRKKR